MKIEKIFISSDHAGFEAKEESKGILKNLGFEIIDLGCKSAEISVDYPDFGHKVAQEVVKHPNFYGIVICGTGIGISIAANKIHGSRCALCHDALTARLAREHNDANILAFGGRLHGSAVIEDILKSFFSTTFLEGRHKTRIALLEKNYGN